MIITLPTVTSGEKSFISDKFGRCNFFYVYDTETKQGQVYTNVNKNGQGGVGIKASEFVINHKSEVLIAPNVGEKSMDLLLSENVKIYHSTNEIVNKNIERFLNGELEKL